MKEPKRESTTIQQRNYGIWGGCDGAFSLIYDADHIASGLTSYRQHQEYILTPEEIQRIKNKDDRLSDINSIGLRNMWISFLKKKGYIKTKRSPLTYTYIPPEYSIQTIDGKKYEVTMKRLT